MYRPPFRTATHAMRGRSFAEVESHCSRAVWVYHQLNQPANSKPVITATTMQALSLVLLGRANEAEALASGCLEAARSMPGSPAERNSFVASCFNCLAEVLRESGRVADAEDAAREGLAIREKVRRRARCEARSTHARAWVGCTHS